MKDRNIKHKIFEKECPNCTGTGLSNGVTCWRCHGAGRIRVRMGYTQKDFDMIHKVYIL